MLSWVTGVQPRRLPSLLPHRGGGLVRGWRRPAPRHLAGHVVACTSRPQSPTPTQPAPQTTTKTTLRSPLASTCSPLAYFHKFRT
jgi:hypothetical protein